jgi:outer membrane protein OmpA-like peptidoglycan-associated protein
VAAPAAPETVERPARQAAAPAPAPRPEPAPAAEPAPEPEPRVAAVPAQAAAPGVTRILFEGAEVDVPDAGRARLTEIARAVQDGNDRIQVRAYADSETETSDWKRRVSLRRAQTVRRVLLDNGVESFRILVRALGEPADEGPGNRVDVEIASR